MKARLTAQRATTTALDLNIADIAHEPSNGA
jgi:hypothetical protein